MVSLEAAVGDRWLAVRADLDPTELGPRPQHFAVFRFDFQIGDNSVEDDASLFV